MKRILIFVALSLVSISAPAQHPEQPSENTPKPTDLHNDGILTAEESLQARNRRPARNQGSRTYEITPTFADVSYGEHPSMKLDFWRSESEEPTALFVWIHGGGFRSGDKKLSDPALMGALLKNGVSFASINYRLSSIGPYPMQMLDSARAIQFLRYKAAEWNIDPDRIAAGGGSAGSGISQWLAFHDDLANPESSDPVERLSTRLCCVLALNMQSTYDPRVVRKIIPGTTFNDSALKLFYGLPDNWNWDTSTIDSTLDMLVKDASPINHLTSDDPPVFIFHFERTRTNGNIHHPNFGNYLEDAMNKLGIPCVRKTDADYASPADSYADIVRFILKYLKESPLP